MKDARWTRADHLAPLQVLELKDGQPCQVFNVSPVLRTASRDIGWIQGGYGVEDRQQELGRLIDLRNRSIAVSYQAEHRVTNDGIEPTGDNLLKAAVYNLEVEDFHTYYVGEQGVWVHNTNCAEPGLAESL